MENSFIYGKNAIIEALESEENINDIITLTLEFFSR